MERFTVRKVEIDTLREDYTTFIFDRFLFYCDWGYQIRDAQVVRTEDIVHKALERGLRPSCVYVDELLLK